MYSRKKIDSLLAQIETLETAALNLEHNNKELLKHIHPDHLPSARNLLHYLAIRAKDLTLLQEELSELAISSNSHSESYALNNLGKIRYLLCALSGKAPEAGQPYTAIDCNDSNRFMKHNAAELFGKVAFEGQSKIMVTLPAEAAEDYEMAHDMVKAGMHIARINTAHDNKDAWKSMIHNVNRAAKASDKHVKIYMDLEGPKIRTGKIGTQPTGHNNKLKSPFILLHKGDKITLTKAETEGHGGIEKIIPLTSPDVFGHVKPNERVWFDDGKIGGMVTSSGNNEIDVKITTAPEEGFKLKEEKGVNFPDSDLDITALTEEDVDHLEFIVKHADMVGFSFVQRPEDIALLQRHLKELKREDIGIILKIETRKAFEHFPALLFAVMQSKHCGIMIARGDLAVEIGYLRIAEVQEEILWLSEAAHLPVIWATQVLETQIKKGIATRAEISDVVKAVRAECVMLNKGPHILEAIETIKDIDKRMAAHEDKKRKILRSLHVAKEFVE